MRVRRTLFLTLLAAATLAAAPDRDREYKVKAGLLRSFANYTTWPKRAFAKKSSPIIFGVIGKDPFGTILKALTTREIGGRAVKVKRVKDAKGAAACHVLFVGLAKSAERTALFKALRGRPILIVGEAAGFAKGGGVIGFVIEKRRVRFEINPDAAAAAGLRLHAKLLRSARIVRSPKKKKKAAQK